MKTLMLISLLALSPLAHTNNTPQFPQWLQNDPQFAATKYKCEGKKYCKQMRTCEEAEFYLKECGLTRLDRDKDGIPCESICN